MPSSRYCGARFWKSALIGEPIAGTLPLPPLFLQNQLSNGLKRKISYIPIFGPQYVLIPNLKSEHIVVVLFENAASSNFDATLRLLSPVDWPIASLAPGSLTQCRNLSWYDRFAVDVKVCAVGLCGNVRLCRTEH